MGEILATVLLVEDDPGVGRLLAAMLRAANYHVLQATTIAEAVAILEDRASPAADVLVADVGLPDGSGAQFALLYRVLRPGSPVVLITGSPGDLPAALHSVATWKILAKPFSPGRLIDEVQRALEEAGREPGHAN